MLWEFRRKAIYQFIESWLIYRKYCFEQYINSVTQEKGQHNTLMIKGVVKIKALV